MVQVREQLRVQLAQVDFLLCPAHAPPLRLQMQVGFLLQALARLQTLRLWTVCLLLPTRARLQTLQPQMDSSLLPELVQPGMETAQELARAWMLLLLTDFWIHLEPSQSLTPLDFWLPRALAQARMLQDFWLARELVMRQRVDFCSLGCVCCGRVASTLHLVRQQWNASEVRVGNSSCSGSATCFQSPCLVTEEFASLPVPVRELSLILSHEASEAAQHL